MLTIKGAGEKASEEVKGVNLKALNNASKDGWTSSEIEGLYARLQEDIVACDLNCPKHGVQHLREFRSDIVKGRVKCPLCQKEEEDAAAKRYERRKAEAAFLKERVPKEYWHKTLDDIEERSANIALAKNAILRLESGEIRAFALLGPCGVGKTLLGAVATMRNKGRMYTVDDITLLIRASYAIHDKSELSVLEEICDLPFLFIDEIARSRGGEQENNWLGYIINKRYSNLLPTMIVGNAHLGRNCPAGGCDKCFEKIIESNILDRLLSPSSCILTIDTQSYRRVR